MVIYWDFENLRSQQAGAIPPEQIKLPSSILSNDSPFRLGGNYVEIWQAIESGYRVKPGDCGPVRSISRFGFTVRCPGKVVVKRLRDACIFREFNKKTVRYGMAELAGDPWPKTDSGFIASWIAGSEYFKIHTGITIFFPCDYYLYQGPIPNNTLINAPTVMAGLEYAVPPRIIELKGEKFGVAVLNVIIPLPKDGEILHVKRGDLLAWFFPIPKKSACLERIKPEDSLKKSYFTK